MEQRKSGETRSTQGSEARRCCKTVSLFYNINTLLTMEDEMPLSITPQAAINRPDRLLESPRLGKVARALRVRVRHDRRRHAFSRWMMRCMSAAGYEDMTTIDVLVLHHVTHRDTAKRLADICFVLNVEDTHVVSYSLKKLAGLKLVSSARKGKGLLFGDRRRPGCLHAALPRCARPA